MKRGNRKKDKEIRPLISTTILSWNRADLLRLTPESYVNTVTVPYEMFIIDNASIEEWKSRPKPRRSSILFPEENISGEKTQPSEECPEPQLWSMFDGWTAEVETLEFLYGLYGL